MKAAAPLTFMIDAMANPLMPTLTVGPHRTVKMKEKSLRKNELSPPCTRFYTPPSTNHNTLGISLSPITTLIGQQHTYEPIINIGRQYNTNNNNILTISLTANYRLHAHNITPTHTLTCSQYRSLTTTAYLQYHSLQTIDYMLTISHPYIH